MRTPLYRFEEFPDLNDPLVPETDEPNVYGEVVFKLGDIRHRFDGEIHSIWDGDVCVFTKREKKNYEH